ncbi:HAD family hydrolase [Sulfolobus sp. A20]|uniref:HAD family hydrolase n=1 Tax=Sulfolobaceae TaxID=118883 RepID=UPI00084624A5|nr:MULTISPECIES: HAD family phosphatase [unclassified Sulfolobus]TRM77837.1 HAD family phosphatase [Sulfolobus sp. B5]TRM78563.1 HAD family phosphatase [Sulfolobus sp. A20-N-F8]TRM83048.1 HAD family phosphatase [Sulfolobus sp. F3]TRM83175.1 HAD family phosphatase [Sulfolobus sp. A20-N-F6]TRM86561.1 HAD family phosphatase [Sulfolobus sp. C3]TRM99377.1 HAD family phosphatase [Sulfolobus sp. E1]TRN00690.1 HAD family phosphatase [Sulfolobus sp. F1]
MKAVIFDLDGTLANTEEIHREAWELALERLGFKVNVDIRQLLGKKTIDIARILVGNENAERLALVKTQIYSELIKIKAKPKPCAIDLIGKLKEKDIKIAVVTSSMRSSATEVLEIIRVKPDVLVAGDDVKIGKPNPMPVIKALELIGSEPKDAIGIGDTIYDVMAYHSAGIKKIFLVKSSVPVNEDEIKRYDAMILHTLCELVFKNTL